MESEGFDETGGDDDGLIHHAEDFEDEDPEDAWFEDFLTRSLSAVEDESGEKDTKGKDKTESVASPRPVARPLQAPSADVMMIEDSPVKAEILDEVQSHEVTGLEVVSSSGASKQDRIIALRAQIDALKEQMDKDSKMPPPALLDLNLHKLGEKKMLEQGLNEIIFTFNDPDLLLIIEDVLLEKNENTSFCGDFLYTLIMCVCVNVIKEPCHETRFFGVTSL